ncbi:MAG: cytochrome b/b6 domain-containing protein [Candidatus Schekmanbacteria bacterium]|nr:MAG: cytochrome b/b6 domain-containing protein [Candidatus Schekmanbacteria bacterium]
MDDNKRDDSFSTEKNKELTTLKETIKEQVLNELREKYGNGFKKDELEKIASRILEDYVEIKDKVLLDYIREEERKKEREKKEKPAEEEKEEFFIRFGLNFRLQHMLLFTSCIVLILTGIPEKFYFTSPAAFFINLVGGMKTITLIHRIGAAGLVCMFLYHCLIYTPFTRQGRSDFIELLPRWKDVTDVIQMIKYFFGKTDEKPKFGRFSYIEKFDYWAVYWGCIIMIGSGFLMWFEVESINLFGKVIVDICKEAHSDEGLLCTLAILIWHFYNVHFNPRVFPMSWVWWNGKISKEDMIEEHPLEYEKIMMKRNKAVKKNE